MPPSDWLLYLQTWMWVDLFMRLLFHSDTLLRQTQVHRPCVRSLHGFLLCTPPGGCYEQAISLHTRRTFPWVEYPWWLANSELFPKLFRDLFWTEPSLIDSVNRPLTDWCAIFYGRTQSKTLDRKKRAIVFCTTTSEDVLSSSRMLSPQDFPVQSLNHVSKDIKQHVISSSGTIYCLSSEHMRPKTQGTSAFTPISLLFLYAGLDTACIEKPKQQAFLPLWPSSLLLIISMCTTIRQLFWNTKATLWTSDSSIALHTPIGYRTSWMFSRGACLSLERKVRIFHISSELTYRHFTPSYGYARRRS